jgi:hypothetical protein
MADLIELTIARLKDTTNRKPPWLDVLAIDSLAQINDKGTAIARTPTLYVFLVSDNPKSDVRGSGAYLQSCEVTIGVVIAEKSTNRQPISWSVIRAELRQRLFGWAPDNDFEPYWLGAGRLIGLNAGRATWLDQFVTEYTEDQNRYVS